jgi:hypothetical protein
MKNGKKKGGKKAKSSCNFSARQVIQYSFIKVQRESHLSRVSGLGLISIKISFTIEFNLVEAKRNALEVELWAYRILFLLG